MVEAFNKLLGHGNGGGPHNIPLQAGVANGRVVEYHYHKWMLYNGLYQEVPQPQGAVVRASEQAGLGLEPQPAVLSKYGTVFADTTG